MSAMNVCEIALQTIQQKQLATPETPVLLMVSGGSDSAALAYIAAELSAKGRVGPVAALHVNHLLRGQEAQNDADFVARMADLLDLPLSTVEVDVGALCRQEKGNLEAVARRVRYDAAHEALVGLCQKHSAPVAQGRIFVAHTADDRVENFYMRSIVGTGPGGFRSMRYLNGQVARPLLHLSRQDLREFIQDRAQAGHPCARTAADDLWCEDATNEHTDRFRAYVRHEIVPLCKERNPQLLQTLSRTMDRIGDEDDMLDAMAQSLFERQVKWLEPQDEGCVIAPALGAQPHPLVRRVMVKVLERLLDPDARVEAGTIDAMLKGFDDKAMNSGYVTNIQGNLAVSANKAGLRIEPMASFRTRRNRL